MGSSYRTYEEAVGNLASAILEAGLAMIREMDAHRARTKAALESMERTALPGSKAATEAVVCEAMRFYANSTDANRLLEACAQLERVRRIVAKPDPNVDLLDGRD